MYQDANALITTMLCDAYTCIMCACVYYWNYYNICALLIRDGWFIWYLRKKCTATDVLLGSTCSQTYLPNHILHLFSIACSCLSFFLGRASHIEVIMCSRSLSICIIPTCTHLLPLPLPLPLSLPLPLPPFSCPSLPSHCPSHCPYLPSLPCPSHPSPTPPFFSCPSLPSTLLLPISLHPFPPPPLLSHTPPKAQTIQV